MTIKEYIKQALGDCPDGDVSFDIGIGVEMDGYIYVSDKSLNRVKFTVKKGKKNENKPAKI
jgi:hypothetical protein